MRQELWVIRDQRAWEHRIVVAPGDPIHEAYLLAQLRTAANAGEQGPPVSLRILTWDPQP